MKNQTGSAVRFDSVSNVNDENENPGEKELLPRNLWEAGK
jgi:hypothetical protein